MKLLNERTKIAKAMNFGRYPVLRINLDDHAGFDTTDYCVGEKVRVAYQSKNYGEMYTRGEIYVEKGEVAISSNAVCVHSDFGYADVMEMAEWANTPIVRAGQEVVVVMYMPTVEIYIVRMMRVGDRVDPHCMRAVTLEDVDD